MSTTSTVHDKHRPRQAPSTKMRRPRRSNVGARQVVHTAEVSVTSNERAILHMAPRDRWEAAVAAGSDYRDPSLDAEGFIHCSTVDQVLIPANERFAGRTDLVLLVIDPTRVPAPTVFEDCYESGHSFPHIYGPIPIASVTNVVPFPCSTDGFFRLPETLC